MNKIIDNISIVIIAANADKVIKKCLDSLVSFKEVILYLNNSSDNTEDIASNFSNTNIFHGPFLGFAKTKTKAVSCASNNWILVIDSDEVIDNELLDSLINLNLSEDCVYQVRRNTFYKNRKIRFCGMSNEKIIRLFNKNITGFNEVLVHESVMLKKLNCHLLNGTINHYSYSSISDLIQKTDSYSSLYASQNTKRSSLFLAIIKSIIYFLKIYLFQLGFLDGYVGFLISYSGANGVFYKYLKLYEKNSQL